jgi:tryptophan-rich sensory protein
MARYSFIAYGKLVMSRNSKWIRDTLGLAVWLLLSGLAALMGAQFGPGDWYTQINKPDWTPPSWVFGPVWTFLYLSMAVAAWLVWRSGGWKANRKELSCYLAQLAANGLWSWLFFGERLIGLAFLDILVMLIMIAVTTVLFWKKSAIAGVLMIPYLLWVGFAAALNYRLWALN